MTINDENELKRHIKYWHNNNNTGDESKGVFETKANSGLYDRPDICWTAVWRDGWITGVLDWGAEESVASRWLYMYSTRSQSSGLFAEISFSDTYPVTGSEAPGYLVYTPSQLSGLFIEI